MSDNPNEFSIPDGHYVIKCDLDAEEPFCVFVADDDTFLGKTTRLLIPKALAYYLSHHSCGSAKMREMIADGTRREIANAIKGALGLID